MKIKTDKELMANFMGLEFVTVGYTDTYEETEWQKNNKEWFDSHYEFHDHSVGDYAVNVKENIILWQEDLKYDTSWDCLIPVWIKFRNLDLKTEDYRQWVHSLQWYLFSSDVPERLFDRLFYAIKWYNKIAHP